jgi:hypothetical protein
VSVAGENDIESLISAMILLEDRLITRLSGTEKTINEAFDLQLKAVADKSTHLALARTASAQAELLLILHKQLKNPALQQAIITKASEIQFAYQDVLNAELQQMRMTNQQRASALATIIKMLKQSKSEHEAILTYLQDDSLSRRLGQVDVSTLGLAYSEARRVADTLNEGKEVSDEEVQKKSEAFEDALNSIRRLISAAEKTAPTNRNE